MSSPKPEPKEAEVTMQNRDPFGLSALPGLQPPSDSWASIAARLQQQRTSRKRWLAGLALAASVTLALGLVVFLPSTAEDILPQSTLTQPGSTDATQQQAAVEPAMVDQADTNALTQGPDNLQSLKNLSRRLEQNLVYLSSSVSAMPAEMVVYQVELEDLVAQVDAAISQQPESSELWQQRVNLLLDLNQIYGEGLRRDDPYVASL